MKQTSLLLLFCLFTSILFSQTKDEVLAEGFLLYHSEKASWHGSDIFKAKFPDKMESIGGYLSYSEGKTHHCVYFDNQEPPRVLAQMTFNNDFDLNKVKIKETPRILTSYETDLYTIRKIAIDETFRDPLFKRYENTYFNSVPLITPHSRKVLVLTGPIVFGVMIIGNDYELTFNDKNKLIETKPLHQDIIPIPYNEETKGENAVHNHTGVAGSFMTSTDICTTMLYQDFTQWKHHIVFSKKHVSFWDCQKKNLVILTRSAYETIYGKKEEIKENDSFKKG